MSRAALQRRLQLGVELRLVYRMDGPTNLARRVIEVRSTGVYLTGPDNRRGWLRLSDSKVFETPAGFEIRWTTNGSVARLLRYEWVSAPAIRQGSLALGREAVS
jgi:hypothetical protein